MPDHRRYNTLLFMSLASLAMISLVAGFILVSQTVHVTQPALPTLAILPSPTSFVVAVNDVDEDSSQTEMPAVDSESDTAGRQVEIASISTSTVEQITALDDTFSPAEMTPQDTVDDSQQPTLVATDTHVVAEPTASEGASSQSILDGEETTQGQVASPIVVEIPTDLAVATSIPTQTIEPTAIVQTEPESNRVNNPRTMLVSASLNPSNLETQVTFTSSQTLRIMPLGDSVTQSNSSHDSYRRRLWQLLQNAGHNVDFVGSLTTNYQGGPPNPDFDLDHEGHWGWRADEILNQINGWTTASQPDIVLMHLGTNDIFQGQDVNSTINEMGQIIDTMRAHNPNIVVLVALVIPHNRGDRPSLDPLNAAIPALVSSKNTAQSPVILVDQNRGFSASSDTFDAVHPNASGEEKMAYRWYGALLSVLPSPTAASGRPRLLVTSDMLGADPDDQQTFVRLLSYSNEFDIVGLVASSTFSGTVRPDGFEAIIDQYALVRDNLILHDAAFPTVTYLRDIVRPGQPDASLATSINDAIGEGKDTLASDWVIAQVDANDPRPLNITAWGGTTDLAQALWRVQNDRSPAEVAAFISKIRYHAIGDQDSAGAWIRTSFPSLFYILNLYPASPDIYLSVYRGIYLGGDTSSLQPSWVSANITSGHGPLGAVYPPNGASVNGVKEGDTPSWFYFLPNGLSDPAHPDWGSWGGRFEHIQNGLWRDTEDTINGTTSGRATVWRWREAFQNDFQARMDWHTQPYAGANHNPVAVINGTHMRTVPPGISITLDASGSTDPDGNDVSYEWFVYPEAGTYTGSVTIANASSQTASLVTPSVTTPETIHIILEVTDNGSPALTSYQRLVITVDPDALTDPVGQPPDAVDDGPYMIIRAGDTLISAPGVLGNDSDPEDNTLLITEYTQPTNGTVTLNVDGSFVYSHNGSSATTDSFTYTITDGNLNYDTATVNLLVAPDLVFTPALINLEVETGTATSTSFAVISEDGSTATIDLTNSGEPWLTIPATVTSGDVNSLTVDATTLAIGTYNATVTASASGYGSDELHIMVTVVDTLPESADVSVVKSAPLERNYNDTLAYNLRVSNAGPGAATNVTVIDTLPGNVTFLSATPTAAGCIHTNGIVTCSVGTMAAGTFIDVRIEVQINLQDESYTLETTNNAPFAVDNLALTHTFPSDLAFIRVEPSNLCSEDTLVVTCDFGTTDPGITQVATVTYFSSEGVVLSNVANVSASEFDANAANNTSGAATTLTARTLANQSPQITQVADQANFNGDVISLVIEAADPEIDSLTYAASGLPDGLTMDTQTGEINGILSSIALANSPYAVTISVDDGQNAPVTMSFNWTILQRLAVTGLTLIDSATDTIIGPLQNGSIINLFVTGNELSILATTDPASVGSVRFALNSDSGFFTDNSEPYTLLGDTNGDYVSWTPTVGQYTLEVIPYSQADAGGYSGISQIVSFEVIDQENLIPEIDAIADQTLIEGEQVTLNIQATDAENDPITLNADILENTSSTPLVNYDLQDNGDGTGTLTLAPQAGSQGTYTATISAADDTGTGTTTFTVTVLVPNQLPSADAGSAQTVEDTDDNGLETITLDGTGSADPDGMLILYEWAENGTVIATGEQPTLDLVVGTHTITLTVTDDRGDTASDTVIITVIPANQPPIADAGSNQTVVDTDRNGTEQVTLDGRNSSDDGTIVSYVWSDSNGQIATGDNPMVSLPVGIHFITLVVTDEFGQQGSDIVTIIVQAPSPTSRVSDNLLALYEFNEGSGNTVNDTSGVGSPLNLTIANMGNATWGTGTLDVISTNTIQSSAAATKINEGIASTDEVTFEAWIQPANTTQDGPARIVTLSGDSSNRNITLGQGLWGTQPKTVFDTRIRTTSSSNNGMPSVTTPTNIVTTNLTHVVFTHASNGTSTIYIDGVAVVTAALGSDLGNWDASYRLTLANEVTGGRSWLGAFHLVAIYNRALTSSEITQNFEAGPEGDSNSSRGPIAVAGPDQIVTDVDNNGSENITLDGSGTIAGDNPIVSYSWYEDGAIIASGPQPSLLLAVGSHDIELLVTDSSGLQSIDDVLIIINQPPQSDAGGDQTVRDDDNNGTEQVTLDGLASLDQDGTITSYIWRENGTQIANSSQPQVALTIGVHTIDLVVTDNHGATDSDTVVITVEPGNALPIADAGPDQTVKDLDENNVETVTISGNGSDTDGTIVSYSWSENGTEIATGQQATVELAVGIHTLVLTVTDNEGGQAADTVIIEVQLGNLPPIADAGPDQTVNDADGNGDETVTLDGTASSDPEDNIIAWDWTLNGVPLATGSQPSLVLPIGVHTITLMVTADNGSVTQSTDTVVVTIVETNMAPVADAGPDQTVPDNDNSGSEQVTLNATASNDDSGIITYSWQENGAEIATGVQPQVNLSVGVHTLTLIVTDAQGRQDNDTVVITVVTNLPPVANAGADQTLEDSNLNTNEPVLLNGTGSFDPDGTIVDYKWFNNGELVGLSAQPTIVLPLGLHTIGLTVTDNNGGQASDTMTVEIFSVPIANAGPDQSVEDTDMNGSASIALDGTGSTLAYSSIIAYDWSLNGTTIATGPVASVDLPVGTHNIVLTVMADRGLTTTATDAVVINITEPDLRVQNGLLALYEFNEGSGSTVTDTSGVGAPLNLVVANPGNVTWNASGLAVNSATIISSSTPATKIIDAARSSNEFTFEAWVTTANTTQNGPARIMSISVDPSTRNTTLGQGAGSSLPTAYNGRVRTTTTSDNGVPNLTTSAGQAATSLRHVVMTRSSSGVTTIYVNGNQVAAANIGGNLSNWNTSYPFMLANELTLDRPWLGTFHLVAVYGRALTPGEIAQNYQAGS